MTRRLPWYGRRLTTLGGALFVAWVAGAGPGPSAAPAPAPADSGYRAPSLLVPARPDGGPPESAPAPFLAPGRPGPPDSVALSLARRARDAYDLGRRLEAAGTPGPAIISYRNALRFDPTLPDANHRMAMLFLTRDQVGEAVKCLLGELSHHPENVESSRQLGLCFARLGDSTRAISHLEALARSRPREGPVWHALGSVYLSASRPRDAEASLSQALRIEPTTAEELRDMGATLVALGRVSEARLYYRRALRLSPADAATWLNLGNIERRASRPDSALTLYRRAEAADSGFVPALQAQIQLLRESKRDGMASDAYRRWLRQHPDHHGARLEAIRLLEASGRDDDALALALEGTAQPRESGESFLILGMVLRGRGDTRGALTALRKAEGLYLNQLAERERVGRTIAALRASAPDSLAALFASDSVAAERRRRR